MPPLHAPRKDTPIVPEVIVELTPNMVRHYWRYFIGLREGFIRAGNEGAAMECNKRLDWLLDQDLELLELLNCT